MMDELLQVIKRHWGFSALRPLQEQAMRAVLDGRDSLVVMPTSGGKGQNILCLDGHVEFRTNRAIDPYLNREVRAFAGSSPFDAPVARSDAMPLPE